MRRYLASEMSLIVGSLPKLRFHVFLLVERVLHMRQSHFIYRRAISNFLQQSMCGRHNPVYIVLEEVIERLQMLSKLRDTQFDAHIARFPIVVHLILLNGCGICNS